MNQYRKPQVAKVAERIEHTYTDDKTLILEQRLQNLVSHMERQDRMIRRLQTEVTVLRSAVVQRSE